MKELEKHGQVGVASARAGMDRGTGRRWRDRGRLPSETKKPRTSRTRKDPFEADWGTIVEMVEAAPELEARALFEWLQGLNPGRYQPGQLRTLQRRLKRWRAEYGPDKEVFFPQQHIPGEAAQTDFTHGTELQITIGGEAFPHVIGHFALPHSNGEWPTVCRSESFSALSATVQDALAELGAVPVWHQTDNSTAATHDLPSGKRGFNQRYVELMQHLGMKPRTTGVGKKEQNGDIEAANRPFKRRVKQHLLLRGSADFETVAAYQGFLRDIARRANRQRQVALERELAVMPAYTAARRPVFEVVDVRVTTWSTVRVKHNTCSVPSRLIGETLRVRVYDDRLECFFADRLQLTIPRLLGRNGHRIDYRHVIWSLVKKPGAFQRYRYRQDLFPSPVFRRAYDALTGEEPSRRTDLAYLRILHLAASTSAADVETAVGLLLAEDRRPTLEAVRDLVEPPTVTAPVVCVGEPDLTVFDGLLAGGGA